MPYSEMIKIVKSDFFRVQTTVTNAKNIYIFTELQFLIINLFV